MGQKWSKKELEDAALVLSVDDNGAYKWSSTKTREQAADMLIGIAAGIRLGGEDE